MENITHTPSKFCENASQLQECWQSFAHKLQYSTLTSKVQDFSLVICVFTTVFMVKQGGHLWHHWEVHSEVCGQ